MDKYKLKLTNSLENLSPRSKLLFAFWASKRLFHNYIYFNELTSFGDIDSMLDAINIIEKFLKGNQVHIDEVYDAIINVDENTPDTDNFDSILVSFALDSCNALSESLRYIIDKDPSHIVDIGLFVRDTVDMFIQELEDLDYSDVNFESKIQENDFMKKEMKAQSDFLIKLKEDKIDVWDKIIFEKIIEPEMVNDLSS